MKILIDYHASQVIEVDDKFLPLDCTETEFWELNPLREELAQMLDKEADEFFKFAGNGRPFECGWVSAESYKTHNVIADG